MINFKPYKLNLKKCAFQSTYSFIFSLANLITTSYVSWILFKQLNSTMSEEDKVHKNNNIFFII